MSNSFRTSLPTLLIFHFCVSIQLFGQTAEVASDHTAATAAIEEAAHSATAPSTQHANATIAQVAIERSMRLAAIAEHRAALYVTHVATQNHAAQLRTEPAKIKSVIDEIAAFLGDYPGDVAAPRLAKLRMSLAFEWCTAADAPFDEFLELIHETPHPLMQVALVADAAAYWQSVVRIREIRQEKPDNSAAVLEELNRFVAAHAGSVEAVRWTAALIDSAYAQRDFAKAARLLAMLQNDHPDEVVTTYRTALDGVVRAAGGPFAPELKDTRGIPFDWSKVDNVPVLLVVIADWDPTACEKVAALVAWCNERHLTCVALFIDSDASVADETARRLGFQSPPLWDGNGWSGTFVRGFAIRRLPAIFIRDARGHFVGIAYDLDAAKLLLPNVSQ